MPDHPLDRDAARLSGVSWLTVLGPGSLRTGDGWVNGRDLLAGLPGWIERIDVWLARSYDRVSPAVAPTYAMGWYLDALARTTGYWLEVAARVPELGPADLDLRLHDGPWPSATAARATRFHCLPGDPAAGHPDARVVPDRDHLVELFGAGVRAHADEFFASFRPRVRIGSGQRLGMLADHVEAALTAGAESAGDRLTGLDDAYRVAGPGNGGLRRSCCFAFRVSSDLLCTRCPRRST